MRLYDDTRGGAFYREKLEELLFWVRKRWGRCSKSRHYSDLARSAFAGDGALSLAPLLALVLCAPLVLAGCRNGKSVSRLERNEIFSLGYGNFEDELNLQNLSGVGEIQTSLVMKDGFFYIANGESKKIMEMNSYGDLITFYYNEDVNPTPSYVKGKSAETSTRKAIPYPFNELSCIAVDSRKYLYAVDKLPLERQEQDAAKKHVLSQIVLRFDRDGNFLDYIGQQGPGGTPFPFIKAVYATEENELVVVSLTNDGYTVYWFSTDGYLLYKVPVDDASVPAPYADGDGGHWLHVAEIIPGCEGRTLFLKVDYYSSFVDETVHLESGVHYEKSFLYQFEVDSAAYGEQPLEIPPYTEQVTEGFSSGHYDIPFDFIGVTDSGWCFFMVSTDDGFSVMMMQLDGQRILRRKLPVLRRDTLYYTFNLSNDGILSALLIQSGSARVDWWRTDSLIQSVIKN